VKWGETKGTTRVSSIRPNRIFSLLFPPFPSPLLPIAELTVFHRSSSRDHPEHIAVAFGTGNVSSALDLARMAPRLRDSVTLAQMRSFLSVYGLQNNVRTLSEAQTFLSRVTLTGEYPDMAVDTHPDVLARLRDNDDRDLAAAWEAPTGPALQELRGPLAALDALAHVDTKATPLHAAAAAAALGLFAGAGVDASSPAAVSAARATLASWRSGAVGGSAERLARRVVREGMLVLRQCSLTTLSRAMEGNAALAAAALKRVTGVLDLAGFPSSGLVGGAAAETAGHPLRFLLFSDVLSAATLPVVDTGVSTERSAVRTLAARALVAFLAAAVSATEASSAGAASPAGDAALASVTRALTEAAEAYTAATDLVLAGKYLPAPPNAPEQPMIAGGAEPAPSAPGVAGPSRAFSSSGGPLSPAFFAELTLLVDHIGPVATVALAHTARAVSAATATDKKAGKGAAAAASKKAPLLTDGAGATAAGVPAGPGAIDAVRSAFSALSRALNGVLSGTKDTKSLVEGNMEKAMTLVTTGFALKACATPFLAAGTIDWKKDKDEPAAGLLIPAPAGTAAGDVGAAYVAERARVRADLVGGAARTVLQSLGASYTNALTKGRAAAEDRLTFLKSVKLP
jgi:hypothetical protein